MLHWNIYCIIILGPGNVQILNSVESYAWATWLEAPASDWDTDTRPNAGAETEDHVEDRLGKQVGCDDSVFSL